MWQYNYTDELCHYGVKGMKWGVRKDSKAYRRGERIAKKAGKRLEKRARQGKKLVNTVVVKPTVKVGKKIGNITVKQLKRSAKVATWFAKKANAILNTTVGAAATVASAFRGKKAVEKMTEES
jgi:hypothetical protein